MIKLIVLENDKPTFSPEVKMFKPFRLLLERDKGCKGDNDGRKKIMSTKELAFIYWFADPRSTYKESYPTEKGRVDKLKIVLDLPEEWMPDELVREAIYFYLEEIEDDFDVQFLEATVNAARKTKEYFAGVDYDMRDNKGNLLYKVKEVTSALKDSNSVIENLKLLRDKVYRLEKLTKNLRGGGDLKRFENRNR